ncbi:fimbria/pilus periplasmic chaperone [Pseudomonas sp. PDM05]|jgi:P pilus assembly chaperone PapD|uniref:fimbria/pilus chaperone family protein n=1 Tax=unclassified Pseudomonas TaxID=196821 RepID=UPI00177CC2DE|nr:MULTISPECIES: fimbria/pilus chaperone family protein [unclassified Pseudomonas]MBD9457652.1 fimbria/pilus periplasmic chaperone [Pseudomonas sp. PDM05]WLH82045.1 fimbria/pilus chaperone family protein [Pseudomonas sp. FP2335]
MDCGEYCVRGSSVINSVLLQVASLFILLTNVAAADGMQPETTVVVLYEEAGEATLNVKNTDAGPALLHSVVENVPEDQAPLLIVTPPITRVEAGDTQLVRFIGTSTEPLKTQRLKRVSFEGIPQARAAGAATIGITLRQNLPLILHPRGLPWHHTPWELLVWRRAGEQLTVHNDSAYVVRLAPDVRLLPQGVPATLPRAYLLPGETLTAKADGPMAGSVTVEIQPATVYGFSVDSYQAPITQGEG